MTHWTETGDLLDRLQ